MEYVEVVASVPWREREAAADAVRAATGADVWIETPFTQPDLESDAEPDVDAPVLVHAYTPAPADGVASRVRERLAGAAIVAEVRERTVREEDWAEAWKEHFHVERFGERLVVVPSWRTYDARADDVTITLDPGMAFGTGQHETTRMCLEALERAVVPDMRVFDVGCGSGILSLAAAKLGAAQVYAVDIEPVCVRVTRENARLNGVAERVRAAEGSAGEHWPFEAPQSGFDVVVANIIARVIVDLAPALTGALAPGGRIVASGVILDRQPAVVAALEAAGGRVDAVRSLGEWVCIEAVRAD